MDPSRGGGISAQLHRVTVAAQTFVLTSSAEAAGLRDAVVRAVRMGGDFVAVATAGGEHFDVLVAPGLPVVFDTVDLPPGRDDEEERTSFEWDDLDLAP